MTTRHNVPAPRPGVWQLLRSLRLWIFAVLGAIGLGLLRAGLASYWPTAEADLGWLGFQMLVVGGAIPIYLALAIVLKPFQVR